MNHATSDAQVGPVMNTDLDSDRLDDLTAEMRWARYRRGVAAAAFTVHQRLCEPCSPAGPGGVPQARCPEGLRLWGVLQRALEDVETLAWLLVPGPAPSTGTLF